MQLHVPVVSESESIANDEELADDMSQKMRELVEDAVEQMQKGLTGVCPPWPVGPSEMWAVPAPPSLAGAVCSFDHRGGMRACPCARQIQRDVHM